MYAQNNVKNIMNITSFNCNGLRSSISYVTELLKTSHIMFMCEHWLLPIVGRPKLIIVIC